MNKSSGYALLFLVMIITMLSLSSSVAVIQQDTRLKRYTEQELKLNLDAVRRAFELYGQAVGYDAALANMKGMSVGSATQFLVSNGYLRQSAWAQQSSNPASTLPTTADALWQFRRNLIKNSSFEDDVGTISTDPYISSVAVALDSKPDYWDIDDPNWEINKSASQKIYKDDLPADNATYVISFWGRWSPPVSATSEFSLAVLKENDQTELSLIKGKSKYWRRYFKAFFLKDLATLTVKLTVNSNKGEAAYFDGLMLELWKNGDPLPYRPSAWAKDFVFTSAIASEALQQTQVFGLADSDILDLPEGWVHRYLEW